MMLAENIKIIDAVLEKGHRAGMKSGVLKARGITLRAFLKNKACPTSGIQDEEYHAFLDEHTGSPATHNAYMVSLNKLREVLGKPRLDRKYLKTRPMKRLDLKRTGDEYERLYNALESDRDRVLLALLRYGGLRVGELIALTRECFEVHDEYIILRFYRPKTNVESEVLLVEPAGLIANYFNRNRFKDKDFIFPARKSKNHPSGVLAYDGAWEVLRKACEKTGITFNLHKFRHFRATELARTKYINNFDLDNYFGWSPNSKTANVYVSLAASETRDKMLEIAGLKPADKEMEITRCPRCDVIVPSEETRCPRCGMSMDPAEALLRAKKLQEIENENEKEDLNSLKKRQQELESLIFKYIAKNKE